VGNESELSQQEDDWGRRATAAAIAAARSVMLSDGAAINMNAPVGRLSDVEWGWVVSAVIFAWIRTRAEQAAAEEIDTERCVRMTGLGPEPWDVGAITAILPELAETTAIDWSQPLSAWSCETMTTFLLTAMRLIRKAMIARDISDRGVTQKSNTKKLNDPLPF
jgi:hypothetical protein